MDTLAKHWGFWGQGYGLEAAHGVLGHARLDLGLTRLFAITSPDNADSIRLLEKLGFDSMGLSQVGDEYGEVRLFSLEVA